MVEVDADILIVIAGIITAVFGYLGAKYGLISRIRKGLSLVTIICRSRINKINRADNHHNYRLCNLPSGYFWSFHTHQLGKSLLPIRLNPLLFHLIHQLHIANQSSSLFVVD